jgi:hypothetical protein
MSELCGVCGKSATKACSGCTVARYCSVECQTKDWSQHAQICGGMYTQYRRQKRHRKMQRLLHDHVAYLYLVAVASVRGLADVTAYMMRLQRNQAELGRFLGKLADDTAFGEAVSGLLRVHVQTGKEFVESGGSSVEAQKRWYANGEEIMELLATQDPTGKTLLWRAFKTYLDRMLAAMRETVRGQTDRAIAQLDWSTQQLSDLGQRLVEALDV